jgi:hypothetical protein
MLNVAIFLSAIGTVVCIGMGIYVYKIYKSKKK